MACCLSFAGGIRAEELAARVKADNVNMRARPDLSSEVVAQAKAEDRLSVVSVQDEWVEVVPPDTADAWVHRDFVKDGLSTVSKLNLRAGPGINYSIVGTIGLGQPLTVRGQFGEWLKVAPSNTSVWISREFVDIVAPVTAVAMPVPVSSAPADAAPPMLPPADAAPPSAATAAMPQPAVPPPADLKLVPLQGQGRSVQREGELKPAPFLFGRPSAFRLVKKEGVQMVTVCYVRGNSGQLNSLMNEPLTIFGREYWVQGVKQPVVVLERIERRTP